MSNIDESVHKHERAFLRSSTCRFPLNEVRDRMHSYLKISGESRRRVNKVFSKRILSDNTSPFDPTKHIIEYLPSAELLSSASPDIIYDLSGGNDTPPQNLSHSIASSLSHFRDSLVSVSKVSFPKEKRLSVQSEEEFLPTNPPERVTRFGSTSSSGGADLARNVSNNYGGSVNLDPKFESVFRPEDMRMLALVSHNNMKHSMKQFVLANKNVIKKFRVTGTNTTMTMLREVFGNDPDVVYGPSCKSGPLGGDAQLVAMAVTGELGGCIFFIDPMDSHPHSADIECLVRQGNVHNIMMMNNPCSAHVCMNACRFALKTGHMEMIPSFFFDMESPSVEAYKLRQKAVLKSNMRRKSGDAATMKETHKGLAPHRKSVIEDFIEDEMRASC